MKTLHISVNDKIATYQKRDGDIICGNSDYQIAFTFDDEWDAHTTKTARFIYGGTSQDVIFKGRTVQVPVLRNTTSLLVGVYAGDLCTTTPARITCLKSILCEDGLPPDPGPDVYVQITEMLQGASGEGNKKISKNSSAFGEDNTVGVKGYYFYSIDFEKKTIILQPWQSDGELPLLGYPIAFEVGDVISIVNSTNYYNCSTITEINGCIITVDSLPFDSVVHKENPVHIDYAVFCAAKPDVGEVTFGDNAFAIGENNTASFDNAFAVGHNNKATGQYGFTQGLHNEAYYAAQAMGRQNKAHGERSFAQGLACQALGNDSHASGRNCVADGQYAMARGYEVRAEKEASNALGYKTKATGTHSMAWNESAKASGTNSTAFGINTEASASMGTAFGQGTKATGQRGTAMGYSTEASNENAVAMGHSTKAAGKHQLVTGKFNKAIDGNTTGFIVGGGSSESARKNALEVDWNGNARFAGDVYANYDGTNKKKLATEEYVDKVTSGSAPSASAKYELIETIELTEDTTALERTKEPSGDDYNFKNLLIVVSGGSVAQSVTNQWIKWDVYYGTSMINIFRSDVDIAPSNRTILRSISDGNFKQLSMSGSSTNFGLANTRNSMMTSLHFLLTEENITQIKLQHESAMPAGTVIQIYGVRV